MKKLITILLSFISLTAFAQIDTASTRRSTVSGFAPKIITDAHLRASSSLTIPFVNSTTPSMNGAVNRAGYGLQLLSNSRLAIGLGSSTFAQFLNTTELGTTYQTLANLSTDLTASTTKYPHVTAVNTGLALKANLASPTFTGTPSLPTGTTAITQAAITNNNTLATTAFVQSADALKANLAGGNTFTGNQTLIGILDTASTAVTPSQGDSTTKVSNTAYVNREFDIRTGWAQYVDNVYTVGSPLSVGAGATVTLTNNAATSNKTQLPTGVTDFYNSGTSKITPQNVGDYYTITLRFKAKNTEATGGYFDFGIDLGGALGIQFKESKLFVKGAGVEQNFNLVTNAFIGATFLANGGIIKITGGNGTTTIYDIDLHVSRTHKAK